MNTDMQYYNKSIVTLELPRILERLAAEASGETAKAYAEGLLPSSDRAEVARRLDETEAAFRMSVLRGRPDFSGLRDIRPMTERADLGGCLNTLELLEIAKVLRCASSVKNYLVEDSVGKTCIDSLFNAIRLNRHLQDRIFNTIISENEIADTASPALQDIRRKIRQSASKVREILQKIISSPSYANILQEAIITTRSDRYVVPVKAEHKGAVQGLVHDVSSSGATVFIEPLAVVKANNELKELEAKEKAEIERILAELSAECGNSRADLDSDYMLLSKLDFIFAKASLAVKMDASRPEAVPKGIKLKAARHPLLDPAKTVPINIELGNDFDTLVITGPNTGGKTVSLKTLGLMSMMNQCGLFIPVMSSSSLPVFSGIYADIGDEQSIEQSLSTFSSHMTNIVGILDECDDNSLVLFDELGAGTDPVEGAALAISIIEHARQTGCIVAATTHYSELKVYATNSPGVQNASCEFDVETLKPTYRLLIGIPGKSNAFAISSRLGLHDCIIEDAKKRIATEHADFEATIDKLEKTRLALEKDREEEQRILRKIREDETKAARLKAELDVRLEKSDIKAKREANRIIAEARQTAEEVFSELDDMKRRLNEEDDFREVNEARNELRRKLNQAEQTMPSVPEQVEEKGTGKAPEAGDTVLLKKLGIKADVISVSPDGILQLRAGIMNLTATESEVVTLESESRKAKKQAVSAGTRLRTENTSNEIDLRGMDSIDAVNTAEQFIDNAIMGGLKSVVIIHGKGTGALRNSVQAMLRKNRSVKSFRLGRYGEGETGVTVVELK